MPGIDLTKSIGYSLIAEVRSQGFATAALLGIHRLAFVERLAYRTDELLAAHVTDEQGVRDDLRHEWRPSIGPGVSGRAEFRR